MPGIGLARDRRFSSAGLRRLVRLLCGAIALGVLPAGAAAAAAPAPAAPFVEGSHQVLAQRVYAAQGAEYRRVLAEFDSHLKQRPDDSVAAVERCRFIANFAGDEGGAVAGAEEDYQQCRQSLSQGPLAASPAAKLFLLEEEYGKSAIQHGEALLPESAAWSAAQRARLDELLAMRYQRDDPLKSGEYALHAVELDPASGQRLNAADYLSRIGARQRAIAVIQGMPAQQWQNWTLRSAVNSLIGLGEAEAAQHLAGERPDIKLDAATRIKLARALLDTGDTAAARALMKALLEEPAPKNIAGYGPERELFEFQRDHGERADAVAAYRKLRDKGYAADPYGRYRLSLSLRHPGAPWRAADLLGPAVLLLYLGLFALAPLLVVMPLHYRGAVKRARGVALPPPFPAWPWGLGHLWYALAVIAVSGALALYIFCYPQFEGLLRQSLPRSGAPADARALAHAYLFLNVFNIVALLPLLHRVPLRPLLLGRWTAAQSLGAGFGISLLVLLVGGALSRALTAAKATAAPGIALGSDTIRAMQGIYELYGAAGLLLSSVLLTPVAEELVFRGVLLRVAARHVRFWLAALIQALLFIALHDQPGAYPLLFLLAVSGAWLAWRSGGLLAPIALHMSNNTFAALAIMGLTRSLNLAP